MLGLTDTRAPRKQSNGRARAADYQRALARLRDLHRTEFEQLYAEERTRQQQPTDEPATR